MILLRLNIGKLNIRDIELCCINICDLQNLLNYHQHSLLQTIAIHDFPSKEQKKIYEWIKEREIKVVIDENVKERSIPKEFEEHLNQLKNECDEAERRISPEDEKTRRDYERALDDYKWWYSSSLDEILGEYIKDEKKIVLYPNAMKNAAKNPNDEDNLLRTTFVHEVMHAYFNRDDKREKLPYILQIEEPLAEFGMLKFMKDYDKNLYEWALDNVSKKNNFYGLGADLMKAYLGKKIPCRKPYQVPVAIAELLGSNAPQKIWDYFENYKSRVPNNKKWPNRKSPSVVVKPIIPTKKPTIDDLIAVYKKNSTKSQKTTNNYASHLRQIQQKYEEIINIPDRLGNILKTYNRSQYDEYNILLSDIKALLKSDNSLSPNTQNDWYSAFQHFSCTILGLFNSNLWFSTQQNDLALCQMVASSVLFASQDVVDKVKDGKLGTQENKNSGGNVYASWDCCTRVRDTSVKKGTLLPNGCIADDNTYANRAIKEAVRESLGFPMTKMSTARSFHNYEACHVWDKPNEPEYYTSIMNLVLVPRAFGQLTDHNAAVKNMLRYEVYTRFGFLPKNEPKPVKPKFYDKIKWRS